MTEQEVLQRCAMLAAPEELPPISDLGIMTCAAPALLERATRSWTEHLRFHHRDPRMIVVDDSPTIELSQAQRAMAGSLRRELGIDLRFIDRAARTALAADMAAATGQDPAILEFALNGCMPPRIGIGASRNVLNLLTRGRRVISADDDIIARFAVPRPSSPALWIHAEDVPMHTYFFDSVAATEAQVPVGVDVDALALHEAFAGETVANVVARLAGRPISLQGAGAQLLDAVQRRPVRIAATCSGLVGDSASDCLGFFSLLATGDTAARVLARLPPLSPSREVMRRPEFPVLCQGVYFITFCNAIDNRLPLPPYFPVGRGEDQVWQKLLHAQSPDTVVAHLPLAVRHRPAGDRRYAIEDYLDPFRVFPGNAFMLGLLSTVALPAGILQPDARLVLLGRHLRDLAGNPQRLAAVMALAWRAFLSHHRALVQACVAARPDHPAWWRDAMGTILGKIDGHLAQGREIPLQYAAGEGPPASEALRQDVVRFGHLLEAWPQVRRAADVLSRRLADDPDWLRP